MAKVQVRPKEECKWDAVSLGEIMVRFDPGEGRIHTTRNFRVWEGGGEYNVTRGLRRCFGQRTATVTAIVDNPIGRPARRPAASGRRRHFARQVGPLRWSRP